MIRELVHLYILHLFTLLFLHQSTSIHLSNSQSLLLLLLFPFSGASFSFLISSRCEKHLFHLSFIIFCLTSFIFHLSSVIFHLSFSKAIEVRTGLRAGTSLVISLCADSCLSGTTSLISTLTRRM